MGLLLLHACTGEQVTQVTVSSVTVSPGSASAVAGETLRLSATVLDENGEPLASAVPDWSSDDPAVASVDAQGSVHARSEGMVAIWARYRQAAGRADVRVLPGPGIAVSRDSVVMSAGVGGSAPRDELVHVTNDGNGSLEGLSVKVLHAEGEPEWLDAELDRTSAPATITLRADPGALAAGTHVTELEVSSSLPGVSAARVVVTLAMLAFSVEETGGETVVSEGGTKDSLLVVLDARPDEDVVLTVTSSDPGEVTVDPARLTFTPESWSTPRVILLAGTDDDRADGDHAGTITIAVDAAASDDALDGVPPRSVDVITLDDDRAELSVIPSGEGITVSEAGTSDDFSVAITARPASDVVVRVVSDDPEEVAVDPARLTFTPESWATPQTVTLTGVDDHAIDGEQRTTVRVAVDPAASDPAFAEVDTATVEVTTLDDDIPGVAVGETGGSTRVSESGTTDEIRVTLTAQPASDVVVRLVASDPGEATITPATLTFTSASWRDAQAAEVRGIDDALADGDQTSTVSVAVDTSASDPAYEGVAPTTIQVLTADDEEAGFMVSESGGGTVVSEDGGTDDVEVALTAQPASNVVVTIASGDADEVTTDPSELTFTPTSWNVTQVVTVTGVDDFADDGNQTSTLTFSVADARSDDAFDSAPDRTVVVTNVDDDEPAGILITEIGGTVVAESGGTDAFTVVLSARPATDVVLDVATDDPGEVEVDPVRLTFASSDWDAAQTVTVTGVDDAVDDGDQVSTVTVSVDPSASDPTYDAVGDATVSVTTTDDDAAGLTILETDGATTVDEAGSTDELSVALTSEPVSDVVLTVVSADPEEAMVTPSTLGFTSATWNVPQFVTVSGVDDAFVDGDQSATLTLSVDPTLSDSTYGSLASVTVAATVVDDDVAGFTVVESGSTVVTESGGSDDFTVVLTAQPETDVILTITTSDAGEVVADPATLLFTPLTWNLAQTVTVSGVDDLLPDGDQTVTLDLAIDAAASDPAFGLVAPQSVSVVNVDDELLRGVGR